MNSDTNQGTSKEKSKKSSPYSLDLSKLTMQGEELEKTFTNYQKLWANAEITSCDIDTLYVCIFCNEPVSPRRKVNIVRKKAKDTIQEAGQDSGQDASLIEYCCLQCSNKIRSYTVSPRTSVKSPSSPVFTPRPKPGLNRSRSTFIKPLLPNGVLSQSWSGRHMKSNIIDSDTPDVNDTNTNTDTDTDTNTPNTPKTVLARRNTDSSVPMV